MLRDCRTGKEIKTMTIKKLNKRMTSVKAVGMACIMLSLTLLSGCGKRDGLTITNVSYDPTREFYEEYNTAFADYYMKEYGKQIKVIQSHGGSGSQARSVVEGCNADVVTLALEHDITLIQNTGLIDAGWKDEYDSDSAPYTSTIVFLVRKGNPLGIKDWDDLIKDGVEVITPDPKSSGGACWNFLAALSYVKEKYTDESSQKEFENSIDLLNTITDAEIVPDKMLLSIQDLTNFLDTIEPSLIILQNITFANAAYAS